MCLSVCTCVCEGTHPPAPGVSRYAQAPVLETFAPTPSLGQPEASLHCAPLSLQTRPGNNMPRRSLRGCSAEGAGPAQGPRGSVPLICPLVSQPPSQVCRADASGPVGRAKPVVPGGVPSGTWSRAAGPGVGHCPNLPADPTEGRHIRLAHATPAVGQPLLKPGSCLSAGRRVQ